MTTTFTGILGLSQPGSFELGQSGVAPLAVHWQCILAVQALLQLMSLSGIPSSSVVAQKVPIEKDYGKNRPYPLPVLIVSPFGAETMDRFAGTNIRDDVGYPVAISIVAAENFDVTTNNLPSYLLLRQQIARAFRNQPLAGVPGIYTCYVEPGQIVVPEAFNKGIWASLLTLRFISREPRGIQ